jgi:hypothetical protein
MMSQSIETVQKSTKKKMEAVPTEYRTPSEPEDSMSSGVESFDEDDMYSADYNDESVSDSPDSDNESQTSSGTMVRALLHY